MKALFAVMVLAVAGAVVVPPAFALTQSGDPGTVTASVDPVAAVQTAIANALAALPADATEAQVLAAIETAIAGQDVAAVQAALANLAASGAYSGGKMAGLSSAAAFVQLAASSSQSTGGVGGTNSVVFGLLGNVGSGGTGAGYIR